MSMGYGAQQAHGLPQRPGLYLARTKDSKWWNLVVAILGQPPYLTLDCWSWADGGTVTHYASPPFTIWFGPEIETENVDAKEVTA